MTGHNRIPTKAPLISDDLFRDLLCGAVVGIIFSAALIAWVIA